MIFLFLLLIENKAFRILNAESNWELDRLKWDFFFGADGRFPPLYCLLCWFQSIGVGMTIGNAYWREVLRERYSVLVLSEPLIYLGLAGRYPPRRPSFHLQIYNVDRDWYSDQNYAATQGLEEILLYCHHLLLPYLHQRSLKILSWKVMMVKSYFDHLLIQEFLIFAWHPVSTSFFVYMFSFSFKLTDPEELIHFKLERWKLFLAVRWSDFSVGCFRWSFPYALTHAGKVDLSVDSSWVDSESELNNVQIY